MKTYTCVCGETKTEAVAKLADHVWNDGAVLVAPTHTSEGVKTYTCECGMIRVETLEKLADHIWNHGIVTTEPTHTAEGVKTYTCVCGETKTEAVAKLADHTYADVSQYNSAQHEKECACGDKVYEDHAWDNGSVHVAPGGTTNGVTIYTCADCGETKYESIPATGEVSGCNAVVSGGFGLMALITLAGAVLVTKKKKA